MKNTLIHKQYWQSNKLFHVTPGDNLPLQQRLQRLIVTLQKSLFRATTWAWWKTWITFIHPIRWQILTRPPHLQHGCQLYEGHNPGDIIYTLYQGDIWPSDTQDFGESCTTHGIKYIVERDQPFLHRLLWLAVVIAGVSRWGVDKP